MRYQKIADLYIKCPELYDELSNDRNFGLEVEYLYSLLAEKDCPKVLELMAGPARHSYYFNENGAKVTAVDSSYKMKELAIQLGNIESDNYHCKDCIDFLEGSHGKFDLIFLLRFGVGYLSPSSLSLFFKYLASSLTINGLAIIEIHNLKQLVQSKSQLDIYEREFVYNGKSLTCIWPDGTIKWKDNSLLAEMTVTIKDKKSLTKHHYISKEYIYQLEQFQLLAEVNSLSVNVLENKFSGSLISIRKN